MDFDARQVEADVKVQAVEDEQKPREERGEFVPGEEPFEADAAETAEE